jgi:homoserine O-acetyltransferase/O-succinyltransferase
MSINKFSYSKSFTLESGKTIAGFHLLYDSFGKLNEDKSNVVWVFHALTANSNPTEWWPGLVGKGKIFDPAKYFIICVNMPGSCYGSVGPLDVNPENGEHWFSNFPWFTIRDMIRAYQKLCKALQIKQIEIGIGGSMGGQQLLEWAIDEPSLFQHIIPIATNAFHSPWGIAFNSSQRMAIEADATYVQHQFGAGAKGLEAARSIAMLSYRNYEAYDKTQAEENSPTKAHKAESYQRYQGEKLSKRFNAYSYVVLSKSMDSHNVGRGKSSVKNALQSITAKTLVVGITTDILFPLMEQIFLAEHIAQANFEQISSDFGHDGFLIESEKLEKIITTFLNDAKVNSNISQKLQQHEQ